MVKYTLPLRTRYGYGPPINSIDKTPNPIAGSRPDGILKPVPVHQMKASVKRMARDVTGISVWRRCLDHDFSCDDVMMVERRLTNVWTQQDVAGLMNILESWDRVSQEIGHVSASSLVRYF